jgi:hypothetical protein
MDGIHLKLAPPHLKVWSIAINNGTASLEAPPDGLIANLAPSKAGTHNPLRQPPPKTTKSVPAPETTFSPVPPPYPPMPSHSGYPSYPQYYYNAYTPSPPQMHRSLPLAPSHLAYQTQFSDGIADEQDPLERLVAYFTWLVAKSPMQTDALMVAKNTLMDAGHTFKTLEKLCQSKLENVGIKEGIAMQLLSYLDVFKSKTLNHA